VPRSEGARKWARRAAKTFAIAFGVVALAFGVLILVTPSVGNAMALARTDALAHHERFPGPAVPIRFATALIATEDHRFGSEPGVDPFAITRVLLSGLTAGGDQGGATLYQQLAKLLKAEGYEIDDFGNHVCDPDDDYPDFALPLARAVSRGDVERGILLCGSGVGASVAANKIIGVRAAVCHDDFSSRQGVEDDDMNILCLGGRTTGVAVAWYCVKSFLAAKFSGAERHRRRLAR